MMHRNSECVTRLPLKRRNETESNESLATTARFRPHCFLQCHGRDEDITDFKQQVWCCKFHPSIKHIAATCGGETVNTIDVNTASVKSRFSQPNEEFYTLDWTTLTPNGGCKATILACGGCLGFIYLIHTEQFRAYGFFKAHTKPVQTLTFVPNRPTYLLSAGNEKKIYLWDIGALSLPDYHYRYKKLAVFEGLKFSPLKMLPFDNQFLLCASEGGLFCWEMPGALRNEKNKSSQLSRQTKMTEIKFPFVDDEPLVDGLAALTEDVLATKCAQAGVIFLWRPRDLISALTSSMKSCTARVLQELKWSNTKHCYINIAACPQQKILLAGDENGSVWVYDCDKCAGFDKSNKKPRHSLLPGEPLPPSEIVSWPRCERESGTEIVAVAKGMIFNEISTNCDASFLIAAADNNLVCIYRSVE